MGFIGLMGFIGFMGFIGLVGFIGFIGFRVEVVSEYAGRFDVRSSMVTHTHTHQILSSIDLNPTALEKKTHCEPFPVISRVSRREDVGV